jgi:hypothetical protein
MRISSLSRILSSTLLGDLFCPRDLLLLELPAHVPESGQCPDTSPDERCGPANDIASFSIDGEDQNGAKSRHGHCSNAPEKTETTQHGAEDMTGFVAAVEGFAVLGSAGTVYTNDVFDHGVNSRAELGTFGDARNSARSGNLEQTAHVDKEKFHSEDEQHGWDWHGDETERRVLTNGATAEMR